VEKKNAGAKYSGFCGIFPSATVPQRCGKNPARPKNPGFRTIFLIPQAAGGCVKNPAGAKFPVFAKYAFPSQLVPGLGISVFAVFWLYVLVFANSSFPAQLQFAVGNFSLELTLPVAAQLSLSHRSHAAVKHSVRAYYPCFRTMYFSVTISDDRGKNVG
jgi:hypothetical protein